MLFIARSGINSIKHVGKYIRRTEGDVGVVRAKREKDVYRQAELRKDFIETCTIAAACIILVLFVVGIIYLIGKAQGKW